MRVARGFLRIAPRNKNGGPRLARRWRQRRWNGRGRSVERQRDALHLHQIDLKLVDPCAP